MLFNIFLLLAVFQIKHFLIDYPLQNKYMLGKFKPDWGFFLPLLAHAGLQGLGTMLICLCFCPSLWWLGIVDMAIHFIMDRIKAGQRYLGRYKTLSGTEIKESFEKDNKKALKRNTYFWWSLGLDQMIHHLTHYGIIYILITGICT